MIFRSPGDYFLQKSILSVYKSTSFSKKLVKKSLSSESIVYLWNFKLTDNTTPGGWGLTGRD